MEQQSTYVGIDVAKDWMDVAVRPTGRIWRVNYEDEEVATLVAQLQTLQPAAVILESTGGLETPLVAALAAAALPVSVVNPRQVRFRQVHRPVGQDRPPGRPDIGPLR